MKTNSTSLTWARVALEVIARGGVTSEELEAILNIRGINVPGEVARYKRQLVERGYLQKVGDQYIATEECQKVGEIIITVTPPQNTEEVRQHLTSALGPYNGVVTVCERVVQQ